MKKFSFLIIITLLFVFNTSFAHRYYCPSIARWTTPDPLADEYPSHSPYNMVLNNPIMNVDPNGLWVAEYDSDGNIVNATYEDGDTYEGLYSQLGITQEDFASLAKAQGVDISKGATAGNVFNITSYVLANTNFSSGSLGNANCASFVLNATGMDVPQAVSVTIEGETLNLPAEESQVSDENFGGTLQGQYELTSTSNPAIGDIGVFTGNYNGKPQNSIHTGIYIMKDQSGQPYYISRNGAGAPVGVSTLSQYRQLYNNATPSVPINGVFHYTGRK